MKKLFLFLTSAIVAVFVLSSCASMKRDCRGGKHVRLSNGIYL